MKKITFCFIISLLLSFFCFSQQVIQLGGVGQANNETSKSLPIGAKPPRIKIENLLNAPQSSFLLSELTGKIVVLEFWATWCGPCIPAMAHLAELQKKFADQLVVIAICDESVERVQRFIKNKPSSIWYLIDEENTLKNYFNCSSIPHSVVLNKEGVIAAITSPNEINEDVINKLLNGEDIKLKTKIENNSGFDFTKDYFPKPDEFNDYSFSIQPPIPGGFPTSRTANSKNSAWFNRRVTLLNSPINRIFCTAFNKPLNRVAYEGVAKEEFDYHTTKQLYCIDVVVPRGKEKELYDYFQQEIAKLDLEYGCRLEKRMLDVVVFTVSDSAKLFSFKSFNSNNSESEKSPQVVTRANNFIKKNIQIDELFLHFENFGIIKQPIVNETGASGLFDISFTFDLENQESFKEQIRKLGLKYEKNVREVEVLVICKK